MYLKIAEVSKSFDGHVALDRVGFSLERNEFVCLLGPSGCGKTTLLRIIAGLMQADSGTVLLGDRDLTDVPARDRNFGIVFQSYSLFPHMTVAENIGYGMKIRGAARNDILARSESLLEQVGMAALARRYPWQLSGGQQQRVAIARALAVDPALLLLDEPFSALDARVRAQMRTEIHQVQRRLGIPTIMVTHDQEEALVLADTVVCMNHGRIEQIGSPREIYLRPKTRFVAHFIGASNLLPTPWVREAMPELLVSRPPCPDDALWASLRPEDIQLTPSPDGNAQIMDIAFLGSVARLTVHWQGIDLIVDRHPALALTPGERVHVAGEQTRCAWVTA